MIYQKTKLPNGLRIVTHEMKDRDSIALGFWIGTGGRYEEDRLKGAAHFLEHVLFKGSKKYSCEEIKEKIEGIGGTLNAFTSEEQTCYYAKIPAKHLAVTFDVLSDMIFHPLLATKDVSKEGLVIIEEIKMYHDLPQYYVVELLDELMWPNHPLGKNLVGTPETIAAMTQKDLRLFHEEFYSPSNIVIAACGRLKHDSFVGMVERQVKPSRPHPCKNFLKADNSQKKPRTHLHPKEVEQMHLALGMLGLPEGHKDRYVLTLLNVILGGNMSSRLFNEIREKQGLAYSIGSSAKSFKDTGVLTVRAGVDNQKLVEAIELILAELTKMKRKEVSKSEFIRAKDYALGQLLLSMEETMEHMLWIGEETICYDRIRTLKEVITYVNKVTMDDIRRLANDIFKENRYNLAIVGPVSEVQQDQLKKIMNAV